MALCIFAQVILCLLPRPLRVFKMSWRSVTRGSFDISATLLFQLVLEDLEVPIMRFQRNFNFSLMEKRSFWWGVGNPREFSSSSLV